MPGSSNLQQWNPGANNQATDAEWLLDVLRTGGAPLGALFPSKTGNKLFYQLSTFMAAFGESLAGKGYVVSDAVLADLIAVLDDIITRADVNSLLAVGDIRFSLSPTPQADEVKLNGAALSRAAYGNLWTWAQANSVVVTEAAWAATSWGAFSSGDLSTTFRVPDFRGEFPRFFDDGRGINAGRVFGDGEADEFKSHGHGCSAYVSTSGQGAPNTGLVGLGPSNAMIVVYPTGGTETRPRNIAVYAFIKF